MAKNRVKLAISVSLFGTEAGVWLEMSENHWLLTLFSTLKCTILGAIFSPAKTATNTGDLRKEDASPGLWGHKWVQNGSKKWSKNDIFFHLLGPPFYLVQDQMNSGVRPYIPPGVKKVDFYSKIHKTQSSLVDHFQS